MKFTVAAVAALVAGAQAGYATNDTVYTTEVVDVYTTYCPEATQLTHNGKTYTVSEATTLTITDCPCTISKPVYTTSAVVCSTCSSAAASSAPVYPTTGYANATVATSVKGTGASYPTTTAKGSTAAVTSATAIPTAGAGKVAALSGAALAGLLGVAALL